MRGKDNVSLAVIKYSIAAHRFTNKWYSVSAEKSVQRKEKGIVLQLLLLHLILSDELSWQVSRDQEQSKENILQQLVT